MLSHLRPAIVLLVLFTALTGLVYPLAITGIAAARHALAGQRQPHRNGTAVVGSALIGQNFTSDRYFQPRPSATSDADPNDSTKTIDAPYNAANSVGSNLGPTSQEARRSGEGRRRGRASARAGPAPVPADAVTTSASGLDPDISPEIALAQARRRRQGARPRRGQGARSWSKAHIEEPCLSALIGEPRVNVLLLNLALDRSKIDAQWRLMARRRLDRRPDPDALLALAGKEGRGKLKVFLGAAPGVGKTYAMLLGARRAEGRGRRCRHRPRRDPWPRGDARARSRA